MCSLKNQLCKNSIIIIAEHTTKYFKKIINKYWYGNCFSEDGKWVIEKHNLISIETKTRSKNRVEKVIIKVRSIIKQVQKKQKKKRKEEKEEEIRIIGVGIGNYRNSRK